MRFRLPPSPVSAHRTGGFTLLELLVAMAIFSVVAVIAYSGLQVVLDARQQTDRESARLTDLLTAMAFLERDIEEAANRGIRDQYGDPKPAMLGSGTGATQLEFTHAGWNNPLQQQRSTLQRVAYLVEGEKLSRANWRMLDLPPESTPDKIVLLDRVSSFEYRFMDKDLKWHDSWPLVTNDGAPQRGLPVAIEITLTLDDWGRITRLFRVPGN